MEDIKLNFNVRFYKKGEEKTPLYFAMVDSLIEWETGTKKGTIRGNLGGVLQVTTQQGEYFLYPKDFLEPILEFEDKKLDNSEV